MIQPDLLQPQIITAECNSCARDRLKFILTLVREFMCRYQFYLTIFICRLLASQFIVHCSHFCRPSCLGESLSLVYFIQKKWLVLKSNVAMFSSNLRNSTLATILFGKDLSQFKSTLEITTALMKRAVHLHSQICSMLLTSYEYLQDHIFKMSHHLTEYERKNLKIGKPS